MYKFKDKIETQSLNSKMGTIEIIQSEQRENRSKEAQTALRTCELKENPKQKHNIYVIRVPEGEESLGGV